MVLKPDEVMAAWLLKGGKMLAKTCKECGCPMFEYKGRTFCVVCEEQSESKDKNGSGAGSTTGEQGGLQPSGKENAGFSGAGMPVIVLGEALSAALVSLCERISKEPDPERCLVLMNTLKKGIEAMQLLNM